METDTENNNNVVFHIQLLVHLKYLVVYFFLRTHTFGDRRSLFYVLLLKTYLEEHSL
jgi:hypothetical protein